ncbi:TonB family protein [gut metagenome]|uniref:TonB family protein n=1 Tax=gut metagenome TaxID=749906 RepID=J9GTG4_9ZZZZ
MFYLFYRLLLSQETFHRFNRFTLLGILGLSALLPWLKVTWNEPTDLHQQLLVWEDWMVLNASTAIGEEAGGTGTLFPWLSALLGIYLLGLVFFVSRQLISLGRMLQLIRDSRVQRLASGLVLVTHRRAELSPFSWMHFVVVSEADLAESGREILLHEQAHVRQRHSWDLLLADVCIFLQWYNPAAWLLKQELQTVHEYEADDWVLRQGVDAKNYQLLLIKKAVGTRLYSMANSFNHSSLKKRITMMLKKKSNPWARVKYLYVFPLAAVTVAAFARPEVTQPLDELSAVKVTDFSAMWKAERGKNQPSSEVNLSAASVLSAPAASSRQQAVFKVKGVVLSATDQQPMIGATVVIKDTNKGTVTNSYGRFELDLSEGQSLVVSYVGFETVFVPVNKPADHQPASVQVVMKPLKDHQPAGQVSVVGTAASTTQEETFMVVEQMPEYPGGMSALMKYLGDHVKYPTEAQKAKEQGRVIVQFVVETDGSVSNIKVVRSVSPLLDAEAIRVMSMMPKWKPGMQRGEAVRVKFTVPVTFRLDAGQATDAAAHSTDSVAAQQTSEGPILHLKSGDVKALGMLLGRSGSVDPAAKDLPLVKVDGKTVSYEEMKTIDPQRIEQINVMKNAEAVKLFGEEAKHGVILITLKK